MWAAASPAAVGVVAPREPAHVRSRVVEQPAYLKGGGAECGPLHSGHGTGWDPGRPARGRPIRWLYPILRAWHRSLCWGKGAIVGGVCVAKAVDTMWYHPSSACECLVVGLCVDDAPLQGAAVGSLPSVHDIIRGPCGAVKVSGCACDGAHVRKEVRGLVGVGRRQNCCHRRVALGPHENVGHHAPPWAFRVGAAAGLGRRRHTPRLGQELPHVYEFERDDPADQLWRHRREAREIGKQWCRTRFSGCEGGGG